MANGNGQQQFDGVTPVRGYTLFRGKDAQNYYLKGEGLSDEEVSQRVANIRAGQQGPAASGQTPGASQITGMSAQPASTGFMDSVAKWTDNVASDIKYGTDITGVGTVLQKMGAHGIYNGNPEAVGDFMASLPLGVLRVAKGGAETNQPGKVWQGTKDIIGGAAQALTIPSAFMGGPVAEEGAQAAGRATAAVPRIWNKATGYTSALEEAKNANLSNYMLTEQKGAQAVSEAEQGVAAAKAAQPAGQAGEWANLNNAVGAPAKAIRIGRGVSDVEEAYGVPGRGLAAEGFDAATLSKMNPTEQAAAIGPKWKAAGQAVGNAVQAATDAGTKLNVGDSLFDVLNKIPNPDMQKKAFELVDETTKALKITNIDAATPAQAWQLRQALKSSARFGPTGDLSTIKGVGTQLYRAVSGDLHDAVDGLAEIDTHYGDLTEAVSAIQKNVQKYAVGKWTPPISAVDKATAKVPDLPNVSPYAPLPTPGPYSSSLATKLGVGGGVVGGAAYALKKLKDSLEGGTR